MRLTLAVSSRGASGDEHPVRWSAMLELARRRTLRALPASLASRRQAAGEHRRPSVSVRRLPAGLSFPNVWVAGDEARRVHAELGHELAARALVPIGRRVEVAVALRERLEGEAREAEPGRMHLCLPAN